MAKDVYAVWDFESGNIIFAYDTEEAALALVREQIDVHGPEAVRQWGLSRERRGRPTPIAEGERLIQRALAEVQHVERSVG
jgi:hypothetical protein